ncbi:cell division protein FtsL [Bacillus massilinigeriensis]|uniref:cell division protein FtsL n=1 Tax=Bacillus massilionigeriensis TaxID=1805475 RepID=UPI00096AF0B8|nr:cell division protein FtsL [Bacillus massilionigeriensis]
MSNLARKLQQEQEHRRKIERKESSKKARISKSWLSPGEKILLLIFGAALCFGGIHLVSNQAIIYNMNKDIQKTEVSIQNQQKVNNDLKMQVSELSTYDRIIAKAKNLGLKLNENNVKVVQER